MKYLRIFVAAASIMLLQSHLLAQNEPEELSNYKTLIIKFEKFDCNHSADNNTASKLRLKAISGFTAYLKDAVRLAIANENDYLEYCWLETEDPSKRVAILASLLSGKNIEDEWGDRFINLAKRFKESEQSSRLIEINWALKNRGFIAQALLEKIKDHKDADGYLGSLQRRVNGAEKNP